MITAHVARASSMDRLGRNGVSCPCILVAHPDMLAWWVPARARAIFRAVLSAEGLRCAQSARTTVLSGASVHRDPLRPRRLCPCGKRAPAADTGLTSPISMSSSMAGWGNVGRRPSVRAIPEFGEFRQRTPIRAGADRRQRQGGLINGTIGCAPTTSFPASRLKPFGSWQTRPAGAITLGRRGGIGNLDRIPTIRPRRGARRRCLLSTSAHGRSPPSTLRGAAFNHGLTVWGTTAMLITPGSRSTCRSTQTDRTYLPYGMGSRLRPHSSLFISPGSSTISVPRFPTRRRRLLWNRAGRIRGEPARDRRGHASGSISFRHYRQTGASSATIRPIQFFLQRHRRCRRPCNQDILSSSARC